MKIAILGHTKGLGAELVKLLESQHEIVGFARSNGYDIDQPGTIQRIVEEVADCDVFINSAKNPSGWPQVDMFSELLLAWEGQKKRIINIGSHVTVYNFTTIKPRFPTISAGHYTAWKQALKTASYHAWQNSDWPMVTLVQPGPFRGNVFYPMNDRDPPGVERTVMTAEQVAKTIVANTIDSDIHVLELTIRSIPKEPK